ncbi:MAG: hypothetical protein ACNA7M_12625, partial [Roseovarius sp.]
MFRWRALSCPGGSERAAKTKGRLEADGRRRHAAAEVRRHPRDKDVLDLELALDEAAARGATTMIVVGVFGGRLDHELAALAVAQ